MDHDRGRGGLKQTLLWGAGLLPFNLLVLSLHIFSHQKLASVDGMYHLRMARLYLERGLFTDFPWMQHAFTRDFWADHHLLYHLLLIPLAGADLVEAQRWAGALWGALALTACSVYLLRHGVGRIWAFAPLLLLSSDHFLFRLMMARSMALALILIIVTLHLLETRRKLPLLLASFLFIWSYHAALIVLPLAAAVMLARRIVDGKWEYSPLLYGGAGLLLGLTLNPFFPDSWSFFFFHTLPLAQLAAGGGGGVPAEYLPGVMEWTAPGAGQWLLAVAPTLLAGVAVPLACWRGRGRWPAGLWLLWGTGLAALASSLMAVRALEYAVPLSYLAAARMLWLTPPAWSPGLRRVAAAAALALALGFGAAYHLDLRDDFTVDPRPVQGAAGWLEANTPAGSTIFHADYTLWAYLFMHNTHNRYIVGLSPLWMYNWDPARWLIYSGVARGRGRDPAATIRHYFGCRHAVVLPWDRGLLRALSASPRAVRVYSDRHAKVYRID